MSAFKLLTPGPLTTTMTVKQKMLTDSCTWDDEYKQATQDIRRELVELAHGNLSEYTSVLMQGSGSFIVESVLTTALSYKDKLLIISNGAYGERMIQMAQTIGINHSIYRIDYNKQPNIRAIESILINDPKISHMAVVHCETTTGILNPIEEIGSLARSYDKRYIVDAMSSFGGIPMNIQELHVDFLVSSANKCIQGVPGFGFAICKIAELQQCEGNARSLALDLYDQWRVMDCDGKWRFTSPTHVVLAFKQALKELKSEGGIAQRHNRYKRLNHLIRTRLKELRMNAYIDEEYQSPIITTFLFPSDAFDFNEFYQKMKAGGFILYPGKLTDVDTFRLGNIGDIDEEDIHALCEAIENYMVVNSNG